MEVETGREAGVIHGPLGDTVDLPVVGTALSGWSPPRYPPAFLRQASSSSLQFQHVPVALSFFVGLHQTPGCLQQEGSEGRLAKE